MFRTTKRGVAVQDQVWAGQLNFYTWAGRINYQSENIAGNSDRTGE